MQFFARFDKDVLRPPGTLSRSGEWRAPSPGEQTVWRALRQWCFDGVDADGARFTIAILQGADAARRAPLLESLSQDLDGSVRMAACEGALAGLRLRLGVKIIESIPWRARRASDPWDCGYLDDRVECLGALPRFRPRRVTLMIANHVNETSLMTGIGSLARARSEFRHPVRLLIDPAPGQGGSDLHASIVRVAQGVPVTIIPFELDSRA